MKKTRRNNAGFTLLEMLVAVAIFTTVGGVALSLVARNVPLYNRQQGTTALNIGLRTAVSQMELDVVNAGTGYYVGPSFPDWPVGVTIINSAGGSCYNSTTLVYGANCFDKMNIITTDLATTPGNLNGATLSSNTTVDVKVPITFINPATGLVWTAAQYAARFVTGDQVLLLNVAGDQMTTFKLTANGQANVPAANVVRLTHTATNANGTNGTNAGAGPVPGPAVACTQSATPANDPMDITRCWNNKLGNSFVANDFLLKLAAVTYQVNTSIPANPRLVRVVGATSDVLADQIIGFKVGASLWNNGNGTEDYSFNGAEYPDTLNPPTSGVYDPYNFTRVRSVRVSLIGRTTPSTDPTYRFRNTFDGGPYQIQAVSMVVNPRNLSMRDQ